MLENHKVIRLVDLLETEDGELFFNSLANSFLSINKDVEIIIAQLGQDFSCSEFPNNCG